MSSWIRVGLGGLFAAWLGLVGWLLAVDLRSWHRTSELRFGRPPRSPRTSRAASSRTTWIAAWAGSAAAAWGARIATTGRPAGAAVTACGIGIAAAGTRTRVTGLTVGRGGLVVHYAARASFAAAWNDLVALRPPGWPLGGWTLVGRAGTRRTLMASDVLGQEGGLESIVGFADFVFDGRDWVRRP